MDNKQSKNEPLYGIEIQLSKKVSNYKRECANILYVFSLIGGISGLLKKVFTFAVTNYNKVIYQTNMITKHFRKKD